MNIFDALDSLNIDWEDLPSLLIHADQLEDIGEIRAGQILRWIARTERRPIEYDFKDKITYDWCSWCVYDNKSDPDYIPEIILRLIGDIFPNSVLFRFLEPGSVTIETSFLSIAYQTLIYTMLYMKDECPIKYWER